jgi:hypothetical protein
MRRTVSAEMLVTTPSATSWRPSSTQSHWLSDRPSRSGRSHAIFTTCIATAGGKDRPAAGSLLVAQAVEAGVGEPLGPLAQVLAAQARLPLDGREALTLGQQQDRPRPPRGAGGHRRAAKPVEQLPASFLGQLNSQRGFAAAHANLLVRRWQHYTPCAGAPAPSFWLPINGAMY